MSNTADTIANASTNPFTLDNDKLMTSMRLACDWLTDIAQTPTDELPANTVNQKGFAYSSWKGAFRGEYSAANRQWWYYCPIWHGGQAVKALVMASEILGDQKYLDAAKLGAQWIFNNQVWDKSSPDHGLILAFEDIADKVNTSAVLECMHGLMMLADQTNSQEMWDRIIAAGDFIVRKMFMPEAGLFRDVYDPAKHDLLLPNPFRTKNDIGGRPLIDDAILLKLYDKTGDTRFRDVHISICETLLRDQNPAGNWLDYGPCSAEKGLFHPRHTYWWGMPMLDTYRETNREEFLKVAIASGEFCQHAM